MAKFSDIAHMDAMLDLIATANAINICTAQPANQAGIAAVSLANAALTPGDGNGTFVKAAGDVSGRKLSVLAVNSIAILTSGLANHVVIDDGVNIYVTTATDQALTSGGTISVPVWDIEVADPV